MVGRDDISTARMGKRIRRGEPRCAKSSLFAPHLVTNSEPSPLRNRCRRSGYDSAYVLLKSTNVRRWCYGY